MSKNGFQEQSRLGKCSKRPPSDQGSVATGDVAPSTQEVPFDDGFHSPVGFAPFLGNALGAIYDRRNVATACSRAFAIQGYDGIATIEPIHVTRPVCCSGHPTAEQHMCQGAEAIEMAIQCVNASGSKLQLNRPHSHE